LVIRQVRLLRLTRKLTHFYFGLRFERLCSSPPFSDKQKLNEIHPQLVPYLLLYKRYTTPFTFVHQLCTIYYFKYIPGPPTDRWLTKIGANFFVFSYFLVMLI
jgi:hypothetical protein